MKKKEKYIPYNYEESTDTRPEELDAQQLAGLLNGQKRYVYATKTIEAGSQMEVEVYPEFARPPSGVKRAKHLAAQRDLNERNSRKACTRVINENFGPHDLWATFTYAPGNEPLDFDEAQANISRYIKRLNYHRKKAGLPSARYVYVTEWQEGGEDAEEIRCHHHIVMDGLFPMDEVEKLWKLGRRNQVRRLDCDRHGLSGLGMYITKAPRGKKKWCASVGLRPPRERKNHRDFGPAAVKKMALDHKEIAKRMERKYPGYWYEGGEVRCNPANRLLYVYAQLRRKARPGDHVTVCFDLLDGVRLPGAGRDIWQVEQLAERAGRPWAKIRAGRRTVWLPAVSLIVVQV